MSAIFGLLVLVVVVWALLRRPGTSVLTTLPPNSPVGSTGVGAIGTPTAVAATTDAASAGPSGSAAASVAPVASPAASAVATPPPVAVEVTALEAIIFDRPTPPAGLNALIGTSTGFIAVGSDATNGGVWTSPNGRDWQRIENPPLPPAGEVHVLRDIVSWAGGFATVGWHGLQGGEFFETVVWASSDGLSWAEAATLPFLADATTAGGPGLVAGGGILCYGCPEQIAIWTSADGAAWTEAPDPPESENGSIVDVQAASAGLVGVGTVGGTEGFAAAAWTSFDGVAWTRVPHEPHLETARMLGVTQGGPGMVAVGTRGNLEIEPAVWTSADGVTWASVDVALGSGSMEAVAETGGRLVAVGNSAGRPAIWTSADATTWTATIVEDVGQGFLNDIVATPSGVIAVGGMTGAAPEDSHPLVVLAPLE